MRDLIQTESHLTPYAIELVLRLHVESAPLAIPSPTAAIPGEIRRPEKWTKKATLS
jgi:hypothetical protein